MIICLGLPSTTSVIFAPPPTRYLDKERKSMPTAKQPTFTHCMVNLQRHPQLGNIEEANAAHLAWWQATQNGG